MIIEELYKVCDDGARLILRHSDDPTKTMRQVETGIIYEAAIDLETAPYTYVEIDKDSAGSTPADDALPV